MIGIAIGAWTPVLAGARLLLGHLGSGAAPIAGDRCCGRRCSRRARLLAFFVLSNLDSLIARNLFDVHESGLYASGLILAKAAFFLPQFVSVVLFPDLARATTHHARLRAVSLVAAVRRPHRAGDRGAPRSSRSILVGGDQYDEIADRLWLFALAGSLLAIVHLLRVRRPRPARPRHRRDDLGRRGRGARRRLRAGTSASPGWC